MNRIALLFAFCFAFGSFGVQRSAAQAGSSVVAGASVAPQARMPAHRPVAPMPPGLVPDSSSAATQTSRPQAGPKTAAVNPPARQIVSGTKGTAKEPEQMKVVRVYHGEGYFDLALAEKLQPLLAKAYGTTPASNLKPGDNPSAPDLLRSIFGQNQGSAKNADQTTVAKTGQP